MFRKLKQYLCDPYYEIGADLLKFCPKLMSDKWWIATLWNKIYGYKLDWDNPRTFNEKLQWLKLHVHNSLYTTLVDKLSVKNWVSEKIGVQYIVPTLAVYHSTDEINIDTLPDQFVLKCNHDSSSAIICKDKSNFDLSSAKRKLEKSLMCNYYWDSREWPYKNVKPCIIAEKLLVDNSSAILTDYKFWCFNGEPKIMYCCVKNDNVWENYYDMDFNLLDINHGYPRCSTHVNRPKNFDRMKDLARQLAINIPFIRIDFYEVNGQVYFGEFTFYDYAGFRPFATNEQELMLGKMIDLSNCK